jgi:hypothetical protein
MGPCRTSVCRSCGPSSCRSGCPGLRLNEPVFEGVPAAAVRDARGGRLTGGRELFASKLFKNFSNFGTWRDAQSSIRIQEGPPPSPAQIRFPAVSGKTPGFSRHSPGSERHSRSPQAVMADRGGKNAARSLARANRFPADFIPTDRDGFACRQRPVRNWGGYRRATTKRALMKYWSNPGALDVRSGEHPSRRSRSSAGGK